MNRLDSAPSRWRAHAGRLVALAVLAALYFQARLPRVSDEERRDLSSRFHFTAAPLADLPDAPHRQIRQVHPSLETIAAWISSVGAGVALSDLDGDGLANDVALVDPRTDLVIVAPAPGTGARYPTFSLDPRPLPYDPSTMAPMGCVAGDLNEDGGMDLLVYYWGRAPIAFLRATRASDAPLQASFGTLETAAGDPSGRAGALSAARFHPCEVAPGGERWYTNAAALADLDGDGHADLVLGNYFPDGSWILDRHAPGRESMQRSMSRAGNGGRNRLLLWTGATSATDPPGSAGAARPSVSFADASGALDDRLLTGWTLALGAADVDGDLLPEIYFANDFGSDRLLHNRSEPGRLRFELLEGARKFSVPSSKTLGRDSFKGMGVEFADLNADGLLDLYVSNIATEFALLESHFLFLGTGDLAAMREGVAPFRDASEPLGLSRSGWAWEARLADFDNDGVLEALQATGFVRGRTNRWPELQELAMGNDDLLERPGSWPRFHEGDDLSGHRRIPFFVRARDGRYVDVSEDVGLAEPHVGRGIATADVDGDGDLDFALANQWEASHLYRNDGPFPGGFLGLHLLRPVRCADPGAASSLAGHATAAAIDLAGRGPDARAATGARGLRAYPAIGAVATITLPDGRKLSGQVDGGNGHSGKRSHDLHFGLGDLAPSTALPVELRWRDAEGRPRESHLALTPGWHTVYLGG